MREPFVHEAVLVLAPDTDTRAPGAAITVALCGHWDHEPPCPLAPHHTAVLPDGVDLRVRTVFVTEPGHEDEVRRRIETALAAGRLRGPDGTVTTWQVRRTATGVLTEAERALAARLHAG
ncbi:hypothetical protein FE374_18765 [Georgenia yuyongxinii]|uniref:Uncharacterized protein n=1 Tax=Georgenia yuyongxinii TaxID=2589797 RepID=A0A5B8CAB8_9MICO|nr:hypothetical protein [Georgenia yuyongxinii]QDC26375.1 hypothetical protein FE374_18765 [Georgenia yuyongxinii]